MKLDIIIVNYNTKKPLVKCLRSIYKNSVSVKVIVVDNGSTDGSQKMIEDDFPQVTLIKSQKNLGFGRANNLGASKVAGEIVLFLNSDTIVQKGALKNLLDFFKTHPRAGVVGPSVVMPSGEIQPYSYGEELNLISLIKNKIIQPKALAKTQVTDWVTGAALAIRRDLFEKLKGFDEKFFMYFEDSDLCLRARSAGMKVYVDAAAKIIHLGGKSISSDRQRSELYYVSQNYFFKKHYGWLGWLLINLIRLPYRIFK